MAVKIRLARLGGKGKPFYRVVVTDSESPRDGGFLEIVGHYNPRTEPAEVSLKHDRISAWIAKGAKPTLTVSQLIKKSART
jgi:small subunit ribosomal protein S16